MLYLLIFGLVLLLSINYKLSRDFISPLFLICVPWLLSSLFLLFSEFDYNTNSYVYLIFLIGILLFDVGFFLMHKKFNPLKINDNYQKYLITR